MPAVLCVVPCGNRRRSQPWSWHSREKRIEHLCKAGAGCRRPEGVPLQTMAHAHAYGVGWVCTCGVPPPTICKTRPGVSIFSARGVALGVGRRVLLVMLRLKKKSVFVIPSYASERRCHRSRGRLWYFARHPWHHAPSCHIDEFTSHMFAVEQHLAVPCHSHCQLQFRPLRAPLRHSCAHHMRP